MSQEKEIKITTLEFPDCVRTRSGMYIGETDHPSVILREVVDNAVDELMGSAMCTKVDIQTSAGAQGGYYVVSDNGRGIPIGMSEPNPEITQTELAFWTLHAGSKFEKDDIAVGMNGLGVSCTNALSKKFVVLSRVTKDNYESSLPCVRQQFEDHPRTLSFYYIVGEKGIKVEEGVADVATVKSKFGFDFPMWAKTVVAFQPDESIFTSIKADYNTKALAYVNLILKKFRNKTAEITVDDKLIQTSIQDYKYDFQVDIDVNNGRWEGRHANCRFYVQFELDKDLAKMSSEGSVNSLVVNAGRHIEWVRDVYANTLCEYYNLTSDYQFSGLHLRVVALAPEVSFSSQTKERCTSLDGLSKSDCEAELRKEFLKIFKSNPSYFDDHVERLKAFIESVQKISSVKKLQNIVGVSDTSDANNHRLRSQVPSKCRDASSSNRKETRLFLVEGDSAGSGVLRARNPKTDAVLPLRGVVLNTVSANLDALMENSEIVDILKTIGSGMDLHNNLKACRYSKIIIATDADPDGFNIASLLIGFFATHCKYLVEDGRVFIGQSPLYEQNGKYYTIDDQEGLDKSKSFRRFKGLGSCEGKDLKATLLNPNEEFLVQVTLDGAEEASYYLSESGARRELCEEVGLITNPYGIEGA